MSNRKGFTLIELSIVIAIIGILATIAIPAYFDLNAFMVKGIIFSVEELTENKDPNLKGFVGYKVTFVDGVLETEKGNFDKIYVPTKVHDSSRLIYPKANPAEKYSFETRCSIIDGKLYSQDYISINLLEKPR